MTYKKKVFGSIFLGIAFILAGLWGLRHHFESTPVLASDLTDCDDGNACTSDDRWIGGLCIGTKVFVSDNNPCTFDSCDPVTGILHVASLNGMNCQDGNACTVGDHCINAMCVPGVPVKCKNSSACTVGVCNQGTGACEYQFSGNQYCDDNNACTIEDECFGTKCIGMPLNCDDSNSRTVDFCSTKIGCFHEPIGG